jgi:hypothetical protein
MFLVMLDLAVTCNTYAELIETVASRAPDTAAAQGAIGRGARSCNARQRRKVELKTVKTPREYM